MLPSTLISGGSIGGIVRATNFRAQDALTYHPGLIATLVMSGLLILMIVMLMVVFDRSSKKSEADGTPIEGLDGFKNTL